MRPEWRLMDPDRGKPIRRVIRNALRFATGIVGCEVGRWAHLRRGRLPLAFDQMRSDGPVPNGMPAAEWHGDGGPARFAAYYWPTAELPFYADVPETLRPALFALDSSEGFARRGLRFLYPYGLEGTIVAQWRVGWDAGDPSFLDRMAPETLQRIRAGEGVVVIDGTTESRLPPNYPEGATPMTRYIAGWAEAQGVPPDRLLLIVPNQGVPPGARIHGIPIIGHNGQLVRIATMARWERPLLRLFAGGGSTAPIAAQRRRRFLCFNATPRPHRVRLLLELRNRGFLAEGLVSCPDLPADIESHWQRVDWVDAAYREIFPRPIGDPSWDFDGLRAALPLVVDVEMRTREEGIALRSRGTIYNANPPWPYLATCFSIVTESDFDGRANPRLTEKTWKPVVESHPFLLVGGHRALAAFRALGFRSFSPWIDERYDEIAESRRRMEALLAEIDRLCTMPIAELRAIRRALAPVLEHNRRWIFRTERVERRRLFDRLATLVTGGGR